MTTTTDETAMPGAESRASPDFAARGGWLVGSGEMAGAIRAFDWSKTALGSREAWPASLRFAVNGMLASRAPVSLLWGEQLIVLYNDAYRESIADRHPGILGRPSREAWPEVWHLLAPIADSVLRRGESVRAVEARLPVVREGFNSDTWFTFSYAPVWEDQGPPVGILLTGEEVTERKHAEQALRESEARWMFALQGSGAGVWDWNIQAGTAYFSKRWKEILGHAEDEIGGSSDEWVNRVHPEDLPGVMADLQAHIDGKTPYATVQHRLRCKDGHWIWVVGRGMVVSRDAAGKPIRLVGTNTDITEQKRAEQVLRAERLYSESLISSLPGVFYLISQEGKFLRWNKKFEAVTGRSAEEMAQISPMDLFEGEDKQAISSAIQRVFTHGEVQVEGWFVAKDGKRTPYQFSGEKVLVDGSPCLIGLGLDITERKRAEEALKASQSRLLLAERMASVGTLAAGVAHEINNPLTFVIGNLSYAVEELQGMPAEAPLREALQEAQQGAERVRHIVRDLKTFSRADEERSAPVDVEALLESSIGMANNEIKHRAQLVRHFAGVPRVMANDSRLGQVFLNLLVNAAQAIPEGRANQNLIRVSTSVDEPGNVIVQIADTGTGIAPEDVGRIFDPFFTTKMIGQGTGLGLSICHGIVSALGGRIEVESKVGKGTEFKVILPVGVAAKEEKPGGDVVVSTALARRARVLIVDDEELVGRLVRRMLGPHYDIESCIRTADALARIASGEKFDAILCDLMMPEMTGMDLYEKLLQEVPSLASRVLFITGGAFTPRAQGFLDKMPNRWLEKPLNKELLMRAINGLLEATGPNLETSKS